MTATDAREPVELSPDQDDLGPIRPDDGIVCSWACAETVPLLDRVLANADRFSPLRVYHGMAMRDLREHVSDPTEIVSYGALGRLGRLPQLRVRPSHFSAIPRLFAAGRLPGDVALVQVAPPDADGNCSLGVGVDYLPDAIRHARVVIAEVNERCPRTAGASLPWHRIDAFVRTSRPQLDAPPVSPGDVERRIAGHVAELVRDGDTIQLGVGALPEAIMGALSGHRDLGVHSGMISDGVLDLIDGGVVTNARKPTDTGVTVTGAALGSQRLFAALDGRTDIVFEPVSRTHDAGRIATVGRLCAINSAIEVDLLGQANSERVGAKQIGAIGGQADFFRGAAATGGRPILALPAKRIVATLAGPVSTAAADVDWVVTEHGACSLAGLSAEDRRTALLRVAGPERADELRAAAAAR